MLKQLYKMIAGMAARQVKLVNSIQLRLACTNNKPQSQGQKEHKEQEQERTADVQSVALEIPVQSVAPPDEVQSYDCYGNPLSTQGLPLTSWNTTQGGNGSTINPCRQSNTNNGRGHRDDDYDDDDGDGYHGYNGWRQSSSRRNQRHQSCPTRSPHENHDQGEDSQENEFCQQQVSLTLHYPPSIKFLMANCVAWLSNSIDGPYEGKLDPLTKGTFQLNDSPSAFWIFYASLRAFFTGCGFNEELLPQLPFVDANLDLTLTPISSDIPNIGAKNGGVAMPHFYWQEQHNRLSSALYALLVSKDIIHSQAKKSSKTISSLHFVTNDFQVIQQLMRMHHPQLANNQAPLFEQVKVACLTMSPHIPAGDYVDALMGYFMDFINWEQQIQMYFEFCIIRKSEYHLLFMQGLAPALRAHVKSQEGNLHVFCAKHRTLLKQPSCDIELFAFSIYERLLAIIGPLEQANPTLSSAQSPRVASINTDLSDFHRIVSSAAPEPEEIVAWCAQIGDSVMVDDVVTAIQGHLMRKRQPQADKRPSALCRHLACSKQHSPNNCCICSGQRHSIKKCWHITGLPAGKQHMADQYKLHFQQSIGP
jgi:hypothetical protein